MIALLRGNIISLSPNSLLIDVNGVGYNCIISLSTFSYLKDKNGKEITILTYHHINDTTQLLFAFHEQEERDVFKMLIVTLFIVEPVFMKRYLHILVLNILRIFLYLPLFLSPFQG